MIISLLPEQILKFFVDEIGQLEIEKFNSYAPDDLSWKNLSTIFFLYYMYSKIQIWCHYLCVQANDMNIDINIDIDKMN